MRYSTQSNTPGAPGNLSPFRNDGLNGLANRQVSQTSGPKVPINYGTVSPIGNAMGLSSSGPTPEDVYNSYRMTQIKPDPGLLHIQPKPIPDVQRTIAALAAQQGTIPMQAVASRTNGTVGGIGNAAWC
jgi:hypothetical protein